MAGMRSSSNAVRYLGAAGILALGGVCAASIFTRPPNTQGSDPQQLALLAARVESVEPSPPLILSAPPPRPRRPEPAPASLTTRGPNVAAATVPQADAPASAPPRVARSVTPAEASVQQIALMGVTQQGDEIAAWLVDLSTQAREVAEAGGSAFGFGVKEVSAESVVLTQGKEAFTVRLGEKEIPVAASEAPAAAAVAQNGAGFGGGRGNRGDGSWRNTQRSYGGGWRSSGSSSNQNQSFNRGSNSRSNNGGNRGAFSGGFPGVFSGGFSGRGNRNGQSFLQPSANPQEARRRGVSFIGDGDALPQPAQIQNPQTQRRRGTVSGPAFGQANGNNRANNGSRTGATNRR